MLYSGNTYIAFVVENDSGNISSEIVDAEN
jgi:hypothetical protein